MSTFYGGEQLVDVNFVRFVRTNFNTGATETVYTVPAGHYAVVALYMISSKDGASALSAAAYDPAGSPFNEFSIFDTDVVGGRNIGKDFGPTLNEGAYIQVVWYHVTEGRTDLTFRIKLYKKP